MSAEKEIVNFWYNQQGYFTITNLKSKGNRDLGIIALRFDKERVADAVYADVSCSISGSMNDASTDVSVNGVVREKFGNALIREAIEAHTSNLPIAGEEMRHSMILGAMPKSRKSDIIAKFAQQGVTVIEFEDVLASVMRNLDTQYHKNDVIRTLQLMKYLLLSDPKKMAEMFNGKMLSSSLKEEFLNLMVSNEEMVKAFRNTEEEKISEIIKHSKLRHPERLALALQQNVLNSKTRKPFVDSLMKEGSIKRAMRKPKKEMSLRKFF